jgi:erythritol kinase (D-erythritol 1-phosphate-forming)
MSAASGPRPTASGHALCVDAGTSLVKAVAYDGDGREVAVARRPVEVQRPAPRHAEQEMSAVWDAVAETLREVGRGLDAGVDMVAITAQGDGCWLVDESGEPVGAAALWSDGRNPGIVEAWQRDGTLERAFEINGSLSFPGLCNAILPWLREHDPARLERAHKALSCGGWIFHQLTGELAVDVSDASAPLLDIRKRAYSEELLALFDLEWARPLLPDIRDMDGRVSALSAAAAEATGLAAGVPVVMAPYDIVATAIGSGATAPGQACSILGTTLCTEVMTDCVDTDGPPSGFTIAMGIGDRYLRAFPTLSGTEVIDWAVRLMGGADPAELGALAEAAPPGAGGIVFLPYLSPAGERAPFLDPNARGAFLGLTLEHRPEHVALAVMEGLSHVVRDCLEAAPVASGELRLCGGGANSDLWCQLIADVTGVPTLRSVDAELGAKGALITGRVATGAEDTIDAAAARLVQLRDRFEPHEARHELYDGRFAQFLELRELCVPAWRRLAAAPEASGAGT